MSLLKKIFGTLTEKPWEQDQAVIDSGHSGKTFEISNQMSAVIIIFLASIFLSIFLVLFQAFPFLIYPEDILFYLNCTA